MIIAQQFTLSAPRGQVWDFLLDVPRSSACMPGVEEVQQTGEHTYYAQVQVRVGPLRAGLSVMVELKEVAAPERVVAQVRGDDPATKSLVQAMVTATLAPAGDAQTVMSYRVDLSVHGVLGRFGQTVIQDVTRKMTAQFVECAERALGDAALNAGREHA